MSVLSVQKLTKHFGSFVAVDGISFELHEGEILGLLGPNGSGKTTTIQMLLSTLSVTSGTIHYFGLPFPENRSVLQSIAFASTYSGLPFDLTMDENLHIIGRLYGLSRKETRAKSEPLLERFGIIDKRKKQVSTLSAGQITRLMIVKAFVIDPKIVLLDEPTASLDPDVALDVCDFLIEQRAKRNISILFTSHRMDEVSKICDRAIFLDKGKIIADDIPSKLARTVSQFRIRLTIIDGFKRTVALAEQLHLSYRPDHRVIELMLSEKDIPPFLTALVQANVTYSNIEIQEPSLEDYFVQLARRKK